MVERIQVITYCDPCHQQNQSITEALELPVIHVDGLRPKVLAMCEDHFGAIAAPFLALLARADEAGQFPTVPTAKRGTVGKLGKVGNGATRPYGRHAPAAPAAPPAPPKPAAPAESAAPPEVPPEVSSEALALRTPARRGATASTVVPAMQARWTCPVLGCGSVCDRDHAVTHVRRVHRAGEKRPIAPKKCPDCGFPGRGKRVVPQGLSSHRRMAHGYDALAEALAGLPTSDTVQATR